MANGTDVLSAELNKIKKCDLIEILITKRVPSSVENNVVIANLVNTLFNADNPIEISNNADPECSKPQCINNSISKQYLKQELVLKDQLIQHLEKRIVDQEMINSLLNQVNSKSIQSISPNTANAKIKALNPIKKRAATFSNMLTSAGQTNLKSAETECLQSTSGSANLNIQTGESAGSSTDLNNGLKEVKNNKNKLKTSITGASVVDTKIKGVNKYSYIYVGHIQGDISVDELSEYLSQTWPEHSFKTVKLDNKGSNSSFKVSVLEEHKNILFDASKWPTGVIVKEYKFFRKNSLKKSEST